MAIRLRHARFRSTALAAALALASLSIACRADAPPAQAIGAQHAPPRPSRTPALAAAAPPLVAAARAQIGVTRLYDPAYVELDYPGGDVPRDRGVCTDVV